MKLGVGVRIKVGVSHRFHNETGTIVAVNDNPLAKFNHYHIRFDREVEGAIGNRELWLGPTDFAILLDE